MDTPLREWTHLIIYITPTFAAMNITDFYNEAPLLASVLTLAYAVVVGAFVYIMVRMYKK